MNSTHEYELAENSFIPASGPAMRDIQRFKFIGHALRGDGPFRPKISYDGYGEAMDVNESALIRYPRESQAKFARRNEVAFYASPLHKACSRFVSYITSRPVTRPDMNDLMRTASMNIDGKGSDIDVFMQDFMVSVRASGSGLLLVDMPTTVGRTLAEQIANRGAPYWTPIDPATVTDFQISETGSFHFVEFSGTYTNEDQEVEDCFWYFDSEKWERRDKEKKMLAEGEHPLGECPVLIYTESGGFPCFGAFSPIADLSKRLFNLQSELDEILRAQTFSILAMQAPEGSSTAEQLDAAKVAGETIGASNLMLYTGSQPGFIAPPDGPARVYLDRIKGIEEEIQEISLQVATPSQRESGMAMSLRFQIINAELSRFSQRMEDLENRAWELSAKWLGQSQAPRAEWPRDFNIADIQQEMETLRSMQETAMPTPVVAAQQRKVVGLQFDALGDDELSRLMESIDNSESALD